MTAPESPLSTATGTSGKPTILVTRKLPAVVEQRLRKNYSPRLNADDHLPDQAELLEGAIGADGLLVTVTDRLDAKLIAELPEEVRIIATFSVGLDHIDLVAARQRGIVVTNTPDVLTDATAEIAMLLLLGAARGATAGEAAIRNDTWENWAPTGMLGVQLSGKRLGIFGMGKIGRAVAHRARAFSMEIHYHNRRPLAGPEQQDAIYHARLEDLLPVCDFLSINCASTVETRGALNAERIAMLPPGAIVVNTARGDIVDDDALIAALHSGAVGAIGLDVYRNEPAIDPRYRTSPNSFLLPHLGSATHETRVAMGFRAVDNLDAFFTGQKPPDIAR